MGCDIHLYTETLRSINGKLQWVNADHWELDRYFEDSTDWRDRLSVISLWDIRNYYMFSILAGVRNYSDNVPISEPRGFPDDVSPMVKFKKESWGSDGHSHSYFTLKELADYKSEPIKYSGKVSPECAKKLDNEGITPREWCEETTIKDWVYREWKGNIEEHGVNLLMSHLKERWIEKFGNWKDGNIEPKDMEKIRVVFWFDN